MKVSGKTLIRFQLFVMIFLFLFSCSSPQNEVIKIGAILPLTGELAFLGVPGKNTLELAQDEINRSGGINGKQIELNFYDSQANPQTGLTSFIRATDIDDINLFITTLSGVSLAIKPMANKKDVLQMVIAIYPNIVDTSDNAIRICYNAQQEAKQINKFIINNNIEKIGVLHSRDSATKKQVNEFLIPVLEEKNIKVYDESFEVGQKDYKTIANKVASWDVSNIILLGYGSDFPGILRELNHLNVIPQNRIIGGIGFLEIPDNIPAKLIENIIFTSPTFSVNQENNQDPQDFLNKYKKKYNVHSVPYDAGFTYDSIMLLAETINNSTLSSPKEIKKAIINLKEYNGVTGKIKILDSGDSELDISWCSFKGNNKPVEYIYEK